MTNNLLIKLSLILIISSTLFAQSDYRITQEFKSRQRAFEIAIEYAKTNDELNKIQKEIAEFKNEFRGNKTLLNRALYPNNFESTFKVLDKKISFTNKKLNKIAQLKSNVHNIQTKYDKATSELKRISSEIYTLRKINLKLMNDLKAFKSGYGGSRESLDSLNKVISKLKTGISERDKLIKEVMDNIFMTAEHKIESLNDAEKKGIKTKIQNVSLIDNINNLINDNIKFLDASLFTLEDIDQMRVEYKDFEQRWKHFGPKLFDIYSIEEQNKEKILEIDSLILMWNGSLNKSVWSSINDIFKSHNIELSDFQNSDEFKEVVVSFINKEINEENDNIELGKDQKYIFFAERVWQEIIKPKWLPTLLENSLITQSTIDEIDKIIQEWHEGLGEPKSLFIYGIIVLLAIIIIISLIIIKRRNKSSTGQKRDFSINEEINKSERM